VCGGEEEKPRPWGVSLKRPHYTRVYFMHQQSVLLPISPFSFLFFLREKCAHIVDDTPEKEEKENNKWLLLLVL